MSVHPHSFCPRTFLGFNPNSFVVVVLNPKLAYRSSFNRLVDVNENLCDIDRVSNVLTRVCTLGKDAMRDAEHEYN